MLVGWKRSIGVAIVLLQSHPNDCLLTGVNDSIMHLLAHMRIFPVL